MKLIIKNGEGMILAQTEHAEEVLLCLDHRWEEGDTVEVLVPPLSHLWLKLNAAISDGEVYCPDGDLIWRVLAGEHRLAYAPGAFLAERNILSVRLMTNPEISTIRDIARNPLDLRGETFFYPHCTANVETRNESVFAARNVIDGLRYNTSHGKWPFQSWCIGAREDAWCKLDFGRTVIVKNMALTLRADFPYDAYWVCGHVVDSKDVDTFLN